MFVAAFTARVITIAPGELTAPPTPIGVRRRFHRPSSSVIARPRLHCRQSPGACVFCCFVHRVPLTRSTWLPFHRRAFTVSSLHFITYAFIACRGTSITRVGACAWRRPSELDTQHRAPRRQLPRERGSGARREKIQATREKAYIRAWHSRFPLAARDRLRLQEDAFRRPRRARGHCRRGLCGLPCNG